MTPYAVNMPQYAKKYGDYLKKKFETLIGQMISYFVDRLTDVHEIRCFGLIYFAHYKFSPDITCYIIRQWWRFSVLTLFTIRTECTCLITAHYDDVIMTTLASQITSLTVVYSIVYSGVDQRKHQSSASLAFVRWIHRDRWIPRRKGQ